MTTSENNNGNNTLLIAIAIAFISVIFLTSCGSRNVKKEDSKTDSIAKTIAVVKTETKINENTNENIKVTNKTEINKKNNIVSDITEITPDDKSKPASVKLPNGQIIDITNAKYRNEKRTDLSKVKFIQLVDYQKTLNQLKNALIQSKKDKETIIELKKEINEKKVEKSQFNWGKFILSFWWLWLILLVAGYIFYRYKKGLIKI